jgi:hypothetical protein
MCCEINRRPAAQLQISFQIFVGRGVIGKRFEIVHRRQATSHKGQAHDWRGGRDPRARAGAALDRHCACRRLRAPPHPPNAHWRREYRTANISLASPGRCGNRHLLRGDRLAKSSAISFMVTNRTPEREGDVLVKPLEHQLLREQHRWGIRAPDLNGHFPGQASLGR